MQNNKLIIAAAGSGKTTFLVNEALRKKDSKILITTYTQANEDEIRRKFIKINKCIPGNVTIQTWFSFLLQHGVKPYQGQMGLMDFFCEGLVLVNESSAQYIAESDIKNHYFTSGNKIYSDKLSKFVLRCNTKSSGAIINRLSRLFTDIFIDEVQDLASYDLDFLILLFRSKINTFLIGDPRQTTYLTHHANLYKKYRDGKINQFINDKCRDCFDQKNVEDENLIINYRSHSLICKLSNRLFPEYRETESGNNDVSEHDGVFFIKTRDLQNYLHKYEPVQLRHSSRTVVNDKFRVLTFGLSKGLEFERVLIYPTSQFIAWLKNNDSTLAPTSRSKFYVAITRAMHSVGIVCDENIQVDGIQQYN